MDLFDLILNLAFMLITAAAVLFAGLKCIHMLQLESYQSGMYFKWISRSGKGEVLSFLLVGIVPILLRLGWVLFYYDFPAVATISWYAGDIIYILMLVLMGISYQRKQSKKPLHFTGRVKRLMVVLAVLTAVFSGGLFLTFDVSKWGSYILMNVLRYLPGLLLPIFVVIAHGITLPLENGIKHWYFNDAKKKLSAREDVIKIGITGSYGKTSTKFMLGSILSEKYNTLITPASYNTPMGITRVIREQLKPEHEAFVAEMGARYVGDIQELCKLVAPEYGIITSVGKQHLETFGSYENVIATKAELILGLKESGAIFINGDNEDCRTMYEACGLKEKFLFGIETENLYMRASDIQVDTEGSSFQLSTADGNTVACRCMLLGVHNILNIAGAAALAYYLGVSLEQIANGIAKLEPVPHRLQLIKGPVTVIDDAFNANPEGTKAALNVLKQFQGRRIVVTPGMVELGAEEDALNEEFGAYMAPIADIVILVGKKHVEPIQKGLLEAGFEPNCIIQVDTLTQATEKLPLYTEPDCVVLFENDLPDNYNE